MHTPCQDAFYAARMARRQFPLTQGVYKLRESQCIIRAMHDSLDAIESLICHRVHYPHTAALGPCCTTEDKASWMKRVPIQIGDLLGYSILPAIEALSGDGLSIGDVERELHSAQPAVEQVLQECDAVHARIKRSIEQEYTWMRQGRSSLRHVLELTSSIPQQALNSVKQF